MTKISVNGKEFETDDAIRAIQVAVLVGHDASYRIFADDEGVLGREYHPDEWIVPGHGDGNTFATAPQAVGPGGSRDARTRLIQHALDAE